MRTIHALYSQGSVDIFGENAGRQCVPMSLCSLIYVYWNNSVLEASDLVSGVASGPACPAEQD